MQMDTHGSDPLTEDRSIQVIHYYNLWRKIASLAGIRSYDEADWENGRLYFRSDYSEKLREWPEWAEHGDWGAWVIAPSYGGYTCVLSSLKHERETQRTEDLEVMFAHLADAGKYIIMRIGDSVRSSLRLKTLYVKWEARGLDPRIQIYPANPAAIGFLNRESPTLIEGYAEKYLKSYTLENNPSSYGFALPDEQPRMEVLALSFEELTTALLDGMPESITSKVPAWRQ
jgi:hypothetical protein